MQKNSETFNDCKQLITPQHFCEIPAEDLFEKSDMKMETWDLKVAKSSANFREFFGEKSY